MCEKKCPTGAIKVTDFVAEIDYEKCTGCGECEKACPRKIIWSDKTQDTAGFVIDKASVSDVPEASENN